MHREAMHREVLIMEGVIYVVWGYESKNDLYEFEVLLGQVSSKIHAAAAAGIALGAGGAVNSQAIFIQ